MAPVLPDLPVGGRLVHFYDKWTTITSDPAVLDIVSGMSIELYDLPQQFKLPHEFHCSSEQAESANSQIDVLLQKRAIVPSSLGEPGEFVSNVFLVPKKDGGFRMILNLKQFNKYVQYFHFKMETLSCILALVQPMCYMATFDLTDAYLTVAINGIHVKFLKFKWQGKIYMYIVLPFGISSAPRKFTKLLKPILSFLRKQGIVILMYIDDGWTMALTYDLCFSQISYVMKSFTSFGFLINKKKSRPNPSQRVTSLGFIIDSVLMMVFLPADKTASVVSFCRAILSKETFSIRFLASFIGTLVSTFPACPFGRLHYRSFERVKVKALFANSYDYDYHCSLDEHCFNDVWWWLNNISSTSCPINRSGPSQFMNTDASDYGWGAVCNGLVAQGHFSIKECSYFIAEKEMIAVYFGLKAFLHFFSNSHVLIRCDNTTAVAYIKDMGGMHFYLDRWAQKIWKLAYDNNFWISISYITSSDNFHADLASRVFSDRTEWSLLQSAFHQIQKRLFVRCTLDLFASRLNNKLKRYVSYIPDPFSCLVDAFTFSWNDSDEIYYLFPPFCLLNRCVQKIIADRTPLALLVFPLWPNQPWFPVILQLIVSEIVVMDSSLLSLPWQTTVMRHPLAPTLRLSAVKISGMRQLSQTFHSTLRYISMKGSESNLRFDIDLFSRNGLNFAFNGRLIPVVQM